MKLLSNRWAAAISGLFLILFANGAWATTVAVGTGPTANFNSNTMFDVTAINAVTINGLRFQEVRTAGTFQIYGRPSTFVGHDSSSAGWTLLGSGALTVGTNKAFPTPFSLTVPAGATYALYVASSDGGFVYYKNSTNSVGSVEASDANLQIKTGVGQDSTLPLFSGTAFAQRVFSGAISYDLVTPVPTMNGWAMVLFGLLFASAIAIMVQRQGAEA